MDDSYSTYRSARAWQTFLIDNPDKSVPVAEYRAQLRAALKASDDAHAAWMGEK
jgi:hypothetical protein